MRDPGLLAGGPCEGARGGPSALGGVGAKIEEPRMGCMVLPGGARPLAWEAREFGGRDMVVAGVVCWVSCVARLEGASAMSCDYGARRPRRSLTLPFGGARGRTKTQRRGVNE
jgi:hypothetical protein